MRKKKALNERLAWTGTHSRYKKNTKKKKKKKLKHIKLEIDGSPKKDVYHLDSDYKTAGNGKKKGLSEDKT